MNDSPNKRKRYFKNCVLNLSMRMHFSQILFFCFMLVGCQVATPEEWLESATISSTRTEQAIPLGTPVSTAVIDAYITPTASSTAVILPSSTVELSQSPTPSPTKILATPTLTPTIVTITPTETFSHTNFTADGFLLYGISTIDEESQIYALQPGGVSHFITTGQLFSGQAFSPDGVNVLVDINKRSHLPLSPEMVFIFNLETGETSPIHLLTYPGNGVFWSLDGTALLYIARYDNGLADQLVLYDIASGENKVLVEVEHILFTAGWSADKQTIAYVAEVDGQYDLFSVNSYTFERQQLTDNSEIETVAIWSPASSQLLLVGTAPDKRSAFELWPWGVNNLSLLDLRNSDSQLLVDTWLGSESTSWSPDGKQIVFSDAGLLCIKDLETLAETCPLANVVPHNEYFASFWEPPVWSTDGNWLAFRAYNEMCDMVYFLELETNTIVSGDLGCDIAIESPIAPIYWLPGDLPISFSP